jgi:hypothetical protein
MLDNEYDKFEASTYVNGFYTNHTWNDRPKRRIYVRFQHGYKINKYALKLKGSNKVENVGLRRRSYTAKHLGSCSRRR